MTPPALRPSLVTAVVLAASLLAVPSLDRSAPPTARRSDARLSVGTADDADAREEMELMMLRDPRTGVIPRDIVRRERSFARTLPLRAARVLRNGPAGVRRSESLVWTERGPNNVGGRTRAFAIDVSAPATLIAGGVAGGIWRSTDDGASWSLRTAPAQIHSTSCVVQDRRAGHTGTWYAGTGEIRGSTTNATRWGSLYLGDGIFKSTDGGLSWTLLPATSTATPQTTDPFDYVVNVATNPANAGQDEVLAATYRGIYRSTDGGGSWTQAIPSDSGFTDVAVTAGGVMYAITRTSGAIKVWRSITGTSWTLIQPATFPSFANRIVIAPAPSNPAVAWFFVQGANNAPAINGHQLWKYTYVSGDGSGAGGTWVNRAANLPSDINTQTGYDQVIHVKPDDENFVILGGTDLFRSTNGFSTTGATTVIGGYAFYPGAHHPDLHSGGFSPANPKVYYSTHDGGLSRAADITIPSMAWTSLDHGYNVTQFYSVAIPPDAGSDVILAGAQDNGSQLGTAPGASDWAWVYGGDGTVVEVSPQADDRLYVQYQGGQLLRMAWNGGDVVYMTPSGATNQLFVDPIVLDPAHPSTLYYAGGAAANSSLIWRADDAPNATDVSGWTPLFGTDVGTHPISALGMSSAGAAHVLWYGTIDGIVMKATGIDGAPTVTDVTPPDLDAGNPTGGFVRCIAVDPSNSERALVAFGNYNFRSLWLTEDGGVTWTDVEGNLAGPAGPSVRWATFVPVGNQMEVFLGTSIGVLSRPALAGGGTVWSQEAASEIGNVIVGYMDYRPSDHTLAVGTHGRGVFTTTLPGPTGVGDPRMPAGVVLRPSVPDPARTSAVIAFDLPQAMDVSLRLYDVSGREVAMLASGRHERGTHFAQVPAGRLAPGAYWYALQAGGARTTRRMTVVR